MRHNSKRTLILTLAVLPAVLGSAPAAAQQAYCNLQQVTITPLSNGVQILVRSDGIVAWGWEGGGSRTGSRYESRSAVRFPQARLALEQTLYQVGHYPVSTVAFYVPQDAQNGVGVVMEVNMTERSRVRADLSEDRQTFLLTIYGQRTVEGAPLPGNGPPAVAEGEFRLLREDDLLSVWAVNANLHQVVAAIGLEGRLNVAVDDAVQHKVSLTVVRAEPLALIRGIAAGYGLALAEVGQVYTLSAGVPTDLATYRRSGTQSFPMRYLKARDATSLLPTFLFRYAHPNPEQNAVVVTAPQQMLEKIGRDLAAIDVPPPMIMVECVVVELTDSRDLDSGFRWAYHSTREQAGVDATTGEVRYERTDPEGALASAVTATPRLQAWLQALVTEGRAHVEAHPSMAAVNGKEAEIFIGSQRFIKVEYLQSGQVQERIESVPVGVRLKLRPWTGGNQEITTELSVEVSNIVSIDPATGVPRLSSRTATTTLRTRDGDTIVIGGLSQTQTETVRRRIPLLGDLPLLGPLFRSQSTRSRDTELAILIRPRLLDEQGRLPATEEETLRSRFLLPDDLGAPSVSALGTPDEEGDEDGGNEQR